MTTQDIILLIDRIRLITRLCNGEYRGGRRYYFTCLELLDTVSRLSDKGGFVDYLEAKGNTRTIVDLHEALCGFLDSSTEQPSQDTPRRLSGMAKERVTLYFYPEDEILLVLRMENLIENCAAWLDILNQYTHKEARPKARPMSQGKARRETETAAASGQKMTAAAARLSSQALQEVKKELIADGLIKDGRWDGTPAEYGELVRHLKDDCGVENRGGYAWTDCRPFAGYQGSDKSAQNAITSNQGDIRGERAATIRRICQRHKVS